MPKQRSRASSAEPPSCCSTSAPATEEEIMCRLCFGEEDSEPGGRLICPCRCCGSVKYIHLRCLQDWQAILKQQGQYKKARACEICKAPYKLPPSGEGPVKRLWELLTRTSQTVLEVLNCQTWPILFYQLWKLYVLGNSFATATRVGFVGLRTGFGMGKALVEDQASMLLRLLTATANVLGTPYAELLWCQAVACLAFAMLSEMVYTSAVGLVVGTVVGFFRGYYSAVTSTVAVTGAGFTMGFARLAVMGKSAVKLAALALRWPSQALRALAAIGKHLPIRLL